MSARRPRQPSPSSCFVSSTPSRQTSASSCGIAARTAWSRRRRHNRPGARRDACGAPPQPCRSWRLQHAHCIVEEIHAGWVDRIVGVIDLEHPLVIPGVEGCLNEHRDRILAAKDGWRHPMWRCGALGRGCRLVAFGHGVISELLTTDPMQCVAHRRTAARRPLARSLRQAPYAPTAVFGLVERLCRYGAHCTVLHNLRIWRMW
jgi:hypothetical protein